MLLVLAACATAPAKPVERALEVGRPLEAPPVVGLAGDAAFLPELRTALEKAGVRVAAGPETLSVTYLVTANGTCGEVALLRVRLLDVRDGTPVFSAEQRERPCPGTLFERFADALRRGWAVP